MKLLLCATVAAMTLVACKTTAPPPIDPVKVQPPSPVVNRLDPLFEDIQRRTFDFFWETAEPGTGLVPDRWPKPPFSSIAAIGFALNASAIGAERRCWRCAIKCTVKRFFVSLVCFSLIGSPLARWMGLRRMHAPARSRD